MTREQLLAVLVVIGTLAAAVQQFYALKLEVAELKLHIEYVHGADWHPPKE